MQAYSDPKREHDPYSLPNVELFYVSRPSDFDGLAYIGEMIVDDTQTDDPLVTGWYYWHCFPGCLPDSDPIGPFETEAEALSDAQSYNEDDTEDN